MRLLRAATLTTADPDATASLYQTWFDYRLLESGIIDPSLAAAWSAPAMSGRPYHILAPASGAPTYLRLIQSVPPPDYQPLRTHGWAAIELCVQDVQAIHDRLKNSPFTIIGPPKALDGAPAIWPMQIQGPDNEIIFLTEIRADEPEARLPRAKTPIDQLFIAVHACANLPVTRLWFETVLALRGAGDFQLVYTTLSRAFGLPADHKHNIAVLTHRGDAFLQLDQYPPSATPRPCNLGELPPGVALVSFSVPVLEPAEQLRPAGLLYAGGLCQVLRSPDGALLELIALDTGPSTSWRAQRSNPSFPNPSR